MVKHYDRMDNTRMRFVNTQDDYDRWEENLREKLELDMQNIHTKNQLDILLRRKGYYNVISDKTPAHLVGVKTTHILNGAWKLLKQGGYITEIERVVEVKREPVKRVPKPRIKIRTIKGYKYATKKGKIYKKLPKSYHVVSVTGFRKHQIRDKATGRIIGWI